MNKEKIKIIQVPSGSQLQYQSSTKSFKTYVLKLFLFYVKTEKTQFETDLMKKVIKRKKEQYCSFLIYLIKNLYDYSFMNFFEKYELLAFNRTMYNPDGK